MRLVEKRLEESSAELITADKKLGNLESNKQKLEQERVQIAKVTPFMVDAGNVKAVRHLIVLWFESHLSQVFLSLVKGRATWHFRFPIFS